MSLDLGTAQEGTPVTEVRKAKRLDLIPGLGCNLFFLSPVNAASKWLQSGSEQTVTIDLKPEQQRVIDLAVRSGAYRDPGEVLDQAFEIIREQLDLEDWMLGQRDELASHIAEGFAQAERGELIDGDVAVETLQKRRAGVPNGHSNS